MMVSMRKYEVSRFYYLFLPVPYMLFLTSLCAFFAPRGQEAIKDLEYLKRTTPEEANVIFQLAKVYRLVGNEVKSAQTLAAARDIAPKSINKMKRLLETVKDDLDDQMDEG